MDRLVMSTRKKKDFVYLYLYMQFYLLVNDCRTNKQRYYYIFISWKFLCKMMRNDGSKEMDNKDDNNNNNNEYMVIKNEERKKKQNYLSTTPKKTRLVIRSVDIQIYLFVYKQLYIYLFIYLPVDRFNIYLQLISFDKKIHTFFEWKIPVNEIKCETTRKVKIFVYYFYFQIKYPKQGKHFVNHWKYMSRQQREQQTISFLGEIAGNYLMEVYGFVRATEHSRHSETFKQICSQSE